MVFFMLTKRILYLFALLIISFSFIITRIYILSVMADSEVLSLANAQREITVPINLNRGIIYDRDLNPLTDCEKILLAVVDPQLVKNINAIRDIVVDEQKEFFDENIKKTAIFTVRVNEEIYKEGLIIKETTIRLSKPFHALHTIGYANDKNAGVMGLESAFDDILRTNDIYSVSFPVDAVRRAISGLGYKINGESHVNNGIALTISKPLQQICEQAADFYIKNGAIVLLDVSDGSIAAMVSRPTFDPYNLQASLNVEGSFMNKALTPYNVGSAFKICDTAAFLEGGGNVNKSFTCTGAVELGEKSITCLDTHGAIDLKTAFAESCNSFFIKLALDTGGDNLLAMSQKFGFGKEINLAPGLSSKKGNIPRPESMLSRLALGNFSIGQGDLLATPLQVSQLSLSVVNGGIRKEPYLVKGLIDENRNLTEYQKSDDERIFSEDTANKVKDLMINTIENGSGRNSKPHIGGAGIKTATAQTGILKEDNFILQGWVTGFFPADKPQYVLTVLVEDVVTGARSAGPVFRYIADEINSLENRY